ALPDGPVEGAGAVGEVAAEGDVDDLHGRAPVRSPAGSTRSASSAQDRTTARAPASVSAASRSSHSSSGTKSRLPTVGHPAATAERTPGTESSTARPAPGGMPRRSQANR